MADFDFSELTALSVDLGKLGVQSGVPFRKAVEVTARKVKDSARGFVSGRKHFKQAASSIDYELVGMQGFGATVLDAEIGYNKGRGAGRLGNLIEFGAPGSYNRLAPGSELQRALQVNEGDFVLGMERALADSLRGAGL